MRNIRPLLIFRITRSFPRHGIDERKPRFTSGALAAYPQALPRSRHLRPVGPMPLPISGDCDPVRLRKETCTYRGPLRTRNFQGSLGGFSQIRKTPPRWERGAPRFRPSAPWPGPRTLDRCRWRFRPVSSPNTCARVTGMNGSGLGKTHRRTIRARLRPESLPTGPSVAYPFLKHSRDVAPQARRTPRSNAPWYPAAH